MIKQDRRELNCNKLQQKIFNFCMNSKLTLNTAFVEIINVSVCVMCVYSYTMIFQISALMKKKLH